MDDILAKQAYIQQNMPKKPTMFKDVILATNLKKVYQYEFGN